MKQASPSGLLLPWKHIHPFEELPHRCGISSETPEDSTGAFRQGKTAQSHPLQPLRSGVTQLTILSSCYFEYHALLSDGIITPISFFWQVGLVKYNPDSKVNKVRERVF